MADEYVISTDKSLLNVLLIHYYLSQESYWAKNIPFDIVQRSIENSLCFGIYYGGKQVDFARVISDQATFAYLADMFVLPTHQGKGLSKQLMTTISNWPTLQGLCRWVLATRDAHTLYEQFGFMSLDKPDFFMQRKLIDNY